MHHTISRIYLQCYCSGAGDRSYLGVIAFCTYPTRDLVARAMSLARFTWLSMKSFLSPLQPAKESWDSSVALLFSSSRLSFIVCHWGFWVGRYTLAVGILRSWYWGVWALSDYSTNLPSTAPRCYYSQTSIVRGGRAYQISKNFPRITEVRVVKRSINFWHQFTVKVVQIGFGERTTYPTY